MPFHSTRIVLILAVLSCGCHLGQSTSGRSTQRTPRGIAAGTISDAAAERPAAGEWRRTAAGWQRTRRWESTVDAPLPPAARIHPLIVAVLIGLLSLGALIGFGSPRTVR